MSEKSREQRKIERLEQGTESFKKHIKDLGGALSVADAAKLLSLTEDRVLEMAAYSELLLISIDGKKGLPVFQFDGAKLVSGLDRVLSQLGFLSPVTRVSFLTSMFFFEDEPELTAVEALRKYGAESEQAKVVYNKAALNFA